jgi:AmmeMemoRadiSam system protein B
MIREPVFAGAFYPADERLLKMVMEDYITRSSRPREVIGLIAPHAGYIYSGGCAGKVYEQVKVPGNVIIMGVNHQGYGHPVAIDGNDAWKTPLGEARIHKELREKLAAGSNVFSIDSTASRDEHSLEVQVPFIQYINPDAKILPVTVASHDLEELLEGGREIARLIKENVPGDALLVASTDMSHFVDAKTAKRKDHLALRQILKLNPGGLFHVVARENISMCGVHPTAMMLAAALELGAQKAELIDYTNSGEATGDYNDVVAYASLAVS